MNDDIETQAEVRHLAEALLKRGRAPLTLRERRMIERIARRVQVHDLNDEFEENQTLSQRLADRMAAIGGSWAFIGGFCLFLASWALLNIVVLTKPFDAYPFIFLNLLLSMLAAIQAPIILMAQNRQAARDRAAADLDYDTNLRSETHILALIEKVDALHARFEDLDGGRTSSRVRAGEEAQAGLVREAA